MKRLVIAIFAIFCTLVVRAQVHEGHEVHEAADHAAADHDHSNESVGVLFEQMGELIAGPPGERILYDFVGVVPRLGLSTQKGLFAEVGLSLDFYRIGYTGASEYLSFGYSNLRPYVSGEIMAGSHLLGGGKVGVEYIRATPILGMAFGAEAGWFTDGSRRAVLVTPRLMLSFVKTEVYYGYNFFVRNELTRWIGHHRVGVTMTLNPRFWRRKTQIHEEYYDTYVE